MKKKTIHQSRKHADLEILEKNNQEILKEMHSVGNHLLLANLLSLIGINQKFDDEYLKAREAGQEIMLYYFDLSKHVEIRATLENNMGARRAHARRIKEENIRTLYQNVQNEMKNKDNKNKR